MSASICGMTQYLIVIAAPDMVNLFLLCIFLKPTVFTFPHCGRVSKEMDSILKMHEINRIIGGRETAPQGFPWMAYYKIYEQKRDTFCGATIITKWFALTAAHCTEISSAKASEVWVGRHQSNQGGKCHVVDRIIRDPNRNRRTKSGDLSLLQLRTPILFTETVHPVCLPSGPEDTPAPGAQGIAMGWGNTETGKYSSIATTLRFVWLDIISLERCRRKLREWDIPGANRSKFLHESNLCTLTNNKDSCHGKMAAWQKHQVSGDSGGPLVVRKDDSFYLVQS